MNYSVIILFFSILLLIEWYAFQAIKKVGKSFGKNPIRLKKGYWIISIFIILMGLSYVIIGQSEMNIKVDSFLRVILMINVFSKLTLIIFILIDDIFRLGKWIVKKSRPKSIPLPKEDGGISRSDFLLKTGLVVAAAPIVTISWGVISGAHDYRVRREKILIDNLPSAFQGLRIAQLSDIHSGSFWNKTAVKGGVELLLQENADIVFFTGDLVNNKSNEMNDWGNIFSKITAPLGVYSVLGNHDYGDYAKWPSIAAKEKNLRDLLTIQKNMGWQVLKNEHDILEIDGERLGIIGVENWSATHNFPKYGNLEKAMQNMKETTANVLLTHDPTHWRAEVVSKYPEINLTLSGHTHGMQFGVDIPGFQWSPSQYIYEEWAGLYQLEKQYLYVNRGFGYIGYPGRIGILPEITILELQKA